MRGATAEHVLTRSAWCNRRAGDWPRSARPSARPNDSRETRRHDSRLLELDVAAPLHGPQNRPPGAAAAELVVLHSDVARPSATLSPQWAQANSVNPLP